MGKKNQRKKKTNDDEWNLKNVPLNPRDARNREELTPASRKWLSESTRGRKNVEIEVSENPQMVVWISELEIATPLELSSVTRLPDRCYSDMSFLFTALIEWPDDPEEDPEFLTAVPMLKRKKIRTHQKQKDLPRKKEIFLTDLVMDGREVLDVLIHPSFPHPVMTPEFYTSTFGCTIQDKATPEKLLPEIRGMEEFVNGYRRRGSRRSMFLWPVGGIVSVSSVVEDLPRPIILGRSLNPSFINKTTLGYAFDKQAFSRVRETSSISETSYDEQHGVLKYLLDKASNYEVRDFDYLLSSGHQISAVIGTLKRWTNEKKKATQHYLCHGTYRAAKEAINGPNSKGIQSLSDFLLNAVRACYFLPKGKDMRRIRCNCNQRGTQLCRSVLKEEKRKMGRTVNTSPAPDVLRRKYIKDFVLIKRLDIHRHNCSNHRCEKLESEPGDFLVCQACREKKTLVRHYYCSVECQNTEWKWSHQLFHVMIVRLGDDEPTGNEPPERIGKKSDESEIPQSDSNTPDDSSQSSSPIFEQSDHTVFLQSGNNPSEASTEQTMENCDRATETSSPNLVLVENSNPTEQSMENCDRGTEPALPNSGLVLVDNFSDLGSLIDQKIDTTKSLQSELTEVENDVEAFDESSAMELTQSDTVSDEILNELLNAICKKSEESNLNPAESIPRESSPEIREEVSEQPNTMEGEYPDVDEEKTEPSNYGCEQSDETESMESVSDWNESIPRESCPEIKQKVSEESNTTEGEYRGPDVDEEKTEPSNYGCEQSDETESMVSVSDPVKCFKERDDIPTTRTEQSVKKDRDATLLGILFCVAVLILILIEFI